MFSKCFVLLLSRSFYQRSVLWYDLKKKIVSIGIFVRIRIFGLIIQSFSIVIMLFDVCYPCLTLDQSCSTNSRLVRELNVHATKSVIMDGPMGISYGRQGWLRLWSTTCALIISTALKLCHFDFPGQFQRWLEYLVWIFASEVSDPRPFKRHRYAYSARVFLWHLFACDWSLLISRVRS